MSNVLRNQRGNFLSWAEKAPWLDDMSGMFMLELTLYCLYQ